MSFLTKLLRLVVGVPLVLSATYLLPISTAWSQSSLCAEVKIEIRQKVSLERQAFDVALKINNGLTDRSIDALRVTLQVTDLSGGTVALTTDPNNTNASFFYRVDALTGTAALNGTSNVAASTQAEARWLFIPASGAAGALPSGKQYRIGALIEYVLAGQAQAIDIEPETITVRAQPKLSLDYFLQQDIYADDPFTSPVEPSEPATLGVRIRNTGLGVASNIKIDSAQPKIVENRQGLAIAFKLEGGYVDDQSRAASLLLDFGSIQPGGTSMGRWDLTTTLAGRFVEFGASFTHADALGGALTSLIESLKTRFLIRDVIVDLPGRDRVRDFLSNDGGLFVYESDGVDTPVLDVSSNATLASQGSGFRLRHQTSTAATYTKLPTPGNSNLTITSVVRSDGKVLNSRNYWVSKKRNEDLSWSYSLNVFDTQSTGDYTINATGVVTTGIAGRVFDDTNSDNQYQTSEPGIGVVRIDLQGTTTNGATSSVAYTEQDGTFAFTALQPGTYSLTVGPTPSRVDGTPTLGNAAGTVGTSGSGAPTISNIVIASNQSASGYLFAKQRTSSSAATDVSVTITPATVNLRPGSNASLLVTVSNLGGNAAQAVAVRFTIPSFAVMNAVTPALGTFDSTASTWYVGALNPGQKVQLRVPFTVLAGAVPPMIASFTAEATSAATETNTANNSASAQMNLVASPVCKVGSAITIEPLVLVRYMDGVRGLPLVIGAYESSIATTAFAATIEQNLAANISAYDFDRSGDVTPEVDGVLYTRWVLGIRGAALIAGVSTKPGVLLADIEAALGACQ